MEVKQSCTKQSKVKVLQAAMQPEVLYEKAYDIAGKVAGTSLGQYAIEKVDRVLSILEKTAKWSLPQTEIVANSDKPSPALERPLPWIPFLTIIVIMRALRISLSLAAILIGNNPVTASSVVYFIQTRRRKLRAVKYQGLRIIRLRKQEANENQTKGILSKFGTVLGFVFCRPLTFDESTVEIVIKSKTNEDKTKINFSKTNSSHAKKHRKNEYQNDEQEYNVDDDDDDDDDDNNLPCVKKLEKYVAEGNDDDDSDFHCSDSLTESSESLSESELDADEKDTIKEKPNIDETIETSKRLINFIMQQKNEQLENEIKNKIQQQIEERMQEQTQTIKSKNHETTDDLLAQIDSVPQILNNPSSVSINPSKIAPKIAQNGKVDQDEKDDKHYQPECDGHDRKGNDNILENVETAQLSDGSATEDQFYSPIGSPIFDDVFANHSVIKGNSQQREVLDNIDSKTFIENEVVTNLQVKLNHGNGHHKKVHSNRNRHQIGNKKF